MKIYNYDKYGFFIKEEEAEKSPLEENVYLFPANSTILVPPTIEENELLRFVNNNWEILDMEKVKKIKEDSEKEKITEEEKIYSQEKINLMVVKLCKMFEIKI